MVQGSFELSNNRSIKIKGKSFDLNSFIGLNNILQKLTHENKTKEINSSGLKISSSCEKESGNGIIISNNMFISSEITTAPMDRIKE